MHKYTPSAGVVENDNFHRFQALREFIDILPPQGASAQLVGTNQQQQPTTASKCVILWGFFWDFRGSRWWGSDCEVFSRIFGCPGDAAQIVRFFPGSRGSRWSGSLCEVFSRIFGGPGDGSLIVRVFSRNSLRTAQILIGFHYPPHKLWYDFLTHRTNFGRNSLPTAPILIGFPYPPHKF